MPPRSPWIRAILVVVVTSALATPTVVASQAHTSSEQSLKWRAVGYITHAPIRFGERVPTPFCTGTLITPRVVLTAAHCFDLTAHNIAFGIGKYADRARIRRARVVVHPRYGRERDLDYDLAYLVLATEVRDVDPMPVRLEGHAESCDYEGIGYGISKDGYEIAPDGLVDGSDLGQRKLVTLCAEAGYAPKRNNTIRGSSGGAAICTGDSGGPLIYTPTGEVVGLASTIASRICDSNHPAFFQPTAAHADFIRQGLAAR